MQEIIDHIAACTAEMEELRGKRRTMPMPHHHGFIVAEDEAILGQIQALDAHIQVLQKTQNDPIYHPVLQELKRHRAWIVADKSLSSPTYTDRVAYIQANRQQWQQILPKLDALLHTIDGMEIM